MSTIDHACGDDGGANCGGGPVGVDCLEEADDSGDMRARHGRTGFDVERDPTVVDFYASWANTFTVCSYDAHSWGSDIRLWKKKWLSKLYRIGFIWRNFCSKYNSEELNNWKTRLIPPVCF